MLFLKWRGWLLPASWGIAPAVVVTRAGSGACQLQPAELQRAVEHPSSSVCLELSLKGEKWDKQRVNDRILRAGLARKRPADSVVERPAAKVEQSSAEPGS